MMRSDARITVLLIGAALVSQQCFAAGRVAREDRDTAEMGQQQVVYGNFNTGASDPVPDGDQLLLKNSQNGAVYLLHYNDNGTLHFNADNTNSIGWTSWDFGSAYATNSTDWSMDAVGDINGDGQGEVIIRDSNSFVENGKNKTEVRALFYTDNGTGKLKGTQPDGFNLANVWVIEGCGNFNLYTSGTSVTNANADELLLRNTDNGALYLLHYNDNGTLHFNADNTNSIGWTSWDLGSAYATNATDWTIDAIGDINGDGQDEVIIRDSNVVVENGKEKTEVRALFYTDNGTGKLKGTQPDGFNLANVWRIESMGNFNLYTNGTAVTTTDAEELLLRNTDNGALYLLHYNDNGTLHFNADNTNSIGWTSWDLGSAYATNATDWSIQAVGDLASGDGQDEVIIRDSNVLEENGKNKTEVRCLIYTDNGTGKLKGTQPDGFNLATPWIIQASGRKKTN